MNVFLKKIFKSFPDRQNFKIFPQRACKHLQNTKKYVIINKLISITIKNGLMVKRLRRCPLTAESAVRFRMGLPKKYSTTLCGAVFFCLPLSGTTRQLVCRRSSICASKFLPRNSVLRKSKVSERACKRKRQLPHGAILLRCAERRGNLFAVVRQFAQANSCRRLPSPALILSYRLHMGNGNFRMGLHTSSLRGTARQLHFYMIKDFTD